jgi:hypothetical protein
VKVRHIFNWQVVFGLVMVLLSVAFYLLHYLIFRDMHHIILYLIGDIAFVFVNVLLVTMIIDKLLTFRDKQAMLKKLNMVIGVFYSEVGTELIRTFSSADSASAELARNLLIRMNWTDKDFANVMDKMRKHAFSVDAKKADLERLKKYLHDKRNFLLMLLENPNLLEHESFTNVLWAVFHLAEELSFRKDTRRLPDSDYEHISGDVKRAYRLIVLEWISYMKHLKSDYPYLFSLAMRTNPFDSDAKAEVV